MKQGVKKAATLNLLANVMPTMPAIANFGNAAQAPGSVSVRLDSFLPSSSRILRA